MLIRIVVLFLILTVAMATDFRRYRIYNLLIALGLALGLVLNCIQSGLSGILGSLMAAVVPAAALIMFFALRMLGAGDIKLFCVIGSIMGIEFILYSMIFSFLAGGFIALAIMLERRNVKERFMHIATYLRSIYLSHTMIPYTNFNDKSDGAKFHFTPAITVGCCIQLLIMMNHDIISSTMRILYASGRTSPPCEIFGFTKTHMANYIMNLFGFMI